MLTTESARLNAHARFGKGSRLPGHSLSPAAMSDSHSFSIDARDEGDRVRFEGAGPDGDTASYLTEGRESRHYFDFFRWLHVEFGTRLPHFFVDRRDFAETPSSWQLLLTDNVSPRILAVDGDPAVLKTGDGYYLLATSNDAPDAFPILH